jgi:hypothetical protein
MNSHQRRKHRRKLRRIEKKFDTVRKLAVVRMDNILEGVSPVGRTNNWEASNVTINN